MTQHQGIEIGRFAPGSDEWHAARANGIGGSEVAAVLGISPFESRFSLWHRKKGLIGPSDVSAAMEWGTRLEDAVCRKFLDEHPEFASVQSATFHHPERPWHIANPDLMLVSTKTGAIEALGEAKTSRYGDGWGTPGTDEIPAYYRPQGMWYMDALGIEVCHFMVLVSGSEYAEYLLHYDADEAAHNAEQVRLFLDTIANDVRPAIDDSFVTWNTMRELHPDINGDTIDVPDDVAASYITSVEAMKAAEAFNFEAKSRLADLMGDAKTAAWNGTAIASRQSRGGGNPYLVAARSLPKITGTVPVATSTDGAPAPVDGDAGSTAAPADRAGSSTADPDCERCDYDRHFCPGCGENISHDKQKTQGCCDVCHERIRREDAEEAKVIAAWLADRVNDVKAFPDPAAIAELARNWPVGVATFKEAARSSAAHTANELDAIEAALDKVGTHHEIPWSPDPRIDAAEVERLRRRRIDEGVDISNDVYNDIKKTVGTLGTVEADVLQRWVKEGDDGGHNFQLAKRRSHRRHRIISAAVTLLRWSIKDEDAREVIGGAMGEEVQPAVPVGVALGNLTAEEADRAIDIVVALAGGANPQFDAAGVLVIPAA